MGWERLKKYWQPVLSTMLLGSGLILDTILPGQPIYEQLRLSLYLIAYLPVGWPVLKQGFRHASSGSLFTEFSLMGIATIGAFLIGEYPEGVAVMLFYSVGEIFQHRAVHNARNNIQALLDVRPETATVLEEKGTVNKHPRDVSIGTRIQVRPGERVPLDGRLLESFASFDTSALTGESAPREYKQDDTVLAGMINLDRLIEIEVTSTYDQSSIAKILELVQHASLRKAKTEQFIRTFARIYTPAVVLLATLLVLLPALFVTDYQFQEWFYRGLVFLVISCPCALVISIPLGYFGGIGAASRHGILVKGGNFLDALTSVKTAVLDKTGTLTSGTFNVQRFRMVDGEYEEQLKQGLVALESHSTHPIAKAISAWGSQNSKSLLTPENFVEVRGSGIQADLDGQPWMVGSGHWLKKNGIALLEEPDDEATVVHFAINGKHKGYIVISDKLKPDAREAVEALRTLGVERLIMLSGDRLASVRKIGDELQLDQVHAELLPEDKATLFEQIKKRYSGTTIYVGDGINDAPVLALSDVGIAMGGMGSDAAVESADVVIQSDKPSKIATAIRIARSTRAIVWQNIFLAMGVKLLVLGLGALGMATLWEAVFADVGVALLAILNAVRIQQKPFT